MKTVEKYQLLRQWTETEKLIALDVETTGLQWWRDKVIGVAFATPNQSIYLDGEEFYQILTDLQIWMSRSKSLFIGHNLKFDLHFFKFESIDFPVADTMVMVHLIDSRLPKSLLEAEKIFLKTDTKKAFLEMGKRRKITQWSKELIEKYCINDVLTTLALFQVLYKRIKEDDLEALFWKDMTYLAEIYRIERRGIKIDPAWLDYCDEKVKEIQISLEEELFDRVGVKFNWRSHKQLSYYLYDVLGVPRPISPFLDEHGVETARNPQRFLYNSTCVSTFILCEKAKHPLGELIASIRECDTIRKQIKLLKSLMDNDCVIHSSFNLTGTRTGRLSSSKPNLQNITSEARSRFLTHVFTGEGMEEKLVREDFFNVRKSLIAREGYKFVSIDYKQMEIRFFALISKDETMIRLLEQGADIHGNVAKQVWGSNDPVRREWAKMISFGLIYGMTMGGIRFRLNMEMEQAQELTEQYYASFPEVKRFLKETVRKCKMHNYLRYWSGRYWREEDPDQMYKGANALVQGGSADLLSVAVIRTARWMRENGIDGHIVNLIHDEILFEIRSDQITDELIDKLKEIMAVPDALGYPFLTDAKIGDSYGNLKEYTRDTASAIPLQ